MNLFKFFVLYLRYSYQMENAIKFGEIVFFHHLDSGLNSPPRSCEANALFKSVSFEISFFQNNILP